MPRRCRRSLSSAPRSFAIGIQSSRGSSDSFAATASVRGDCGWAAACRIRAGRCSRSGLTSSARMILRRRANFLTTIPQWSSSTRARLPSGATCCSCASGSSSLATPPVSSGTRYAQVVARLSLRSVRDQWRLRLGQPSELSMLPRGHSKMSVNTERTKHTAQPSHKTSSDSFATKSPSSPTRQIRARGRARRKYWQNNSVGKRRRRGGAAASR
mmetsp:Transcript_11367/g.19064  ORF Transcript_11367/g.19064 Transcript_11367/m.19064 type:complete len:214 (+) Transcript_11367:482-1123(+)